mmetsp:Transcript_17472/g.41114  ORF Transcript_17472/g.41114 Transcript_17472/m.41114 type:complete len:357 (-) Transcript_17472:405-1475(-)
MYRDGVADTTFTKIFVGGLAWETRTETLKSYFEQFGESLEAVVIFDKQTGKSKGYGFVTYVRPDDAQAALQNPNPIIDGRRTNCNLAAFGRRQRGGMNGVAVGGFYGQGQDMMGGYGAGFGAQMFPNFPYGAGMGPGMYGPHTHMGLYAPRPQIYPGAMGAPGGYPLPPLNPTDPYSFYGLGTYAGAGAGWYGAGDQLPNGTGSVDGTPVPDDPTAAVASVSPGMLHPGYGDGAGFSGDRMAGMPRPGWPGQQWPTPPHIFQQQMQQMQQLQMAASADAGEANPDVTTPGSEEQAANQQAQPQKPTKASGESASDAKGPPASPQESWANKGGEAVPQEEDAGDDETVRRMAAVKIA